MLVRKRDLDQDSGSLALRNEIDRSTQHRCALPHAVNSQAVRGNSRGLGIKAASIVHNRYLDSRAQWFKLNADRLCARVPGNIRQGFLQNAIQSNLHSRRQVDGVKLIQREIDSDVVVL